jgi:hypothetical protein
MDGTRFDRIIKALVARGHRRDALKALAGSGLVAVAAAAEGEGVTAKQKKRCRQRGHTCGGKKKCCGKKDKCRSSGDPQCLLSGSYCCGIEGAPCSKDDPSGLGVCECCGGLHCGGIEPHRCVPEGT